MAAALLMVAGTRADAAAAVADADAGAGATSDDAPIAIGPYADGYSAVDSAGKWDGAYSVYRLAVAQSFGVLGAAFAASDDPRLRPLTRLDTSLNVTAPVASLPMRLGDGVSSVGMWEQPVRMGGIQIGSLQPAPPEVTAPPSFIAAPSAGPAPAATHFIDGLRSLIQIQNPALASAGQGGFSMEAGRLRENFEIRSNDYGPWMTSGTYRYGVSATTTVDGQFAQVAGQQNFMGLGVIEGLGPLGVLSARVAGSRDPDSYGWLARMGYDYSRNGLSVAVRSHIQSSAFQEVGDVSVSNSFRQRTLASAGIDLGGLGRLALASAVETVGDEPRRDVIALSHAIPFGGGGILSTAAAYSPGQLGNAALLLSFTYPFAGLRVPGARLAGAVDGLDRSIVDVFGQSRLPTARLVPDRSGQL